MSGEPTPQAEQPHPRKTPRLKQRLSLEALTQVFSDCADFSARQLRLGGTGQVVTVCWLEGMAKTERLNDYVFRPLAQDRRLEAARDEAALALLVQGTLYAQKVKVEREMDPVAQGLICGSCALFLQGEKERALVIPVPTEEKRSIGQPENEPSLKGARDSFVESVRTNTSWCAAACGPRS